MLPEAPRQHIAVGVVVVCDQDAWPIVRPHTLRTQRPVDAGDELVGREIALAGQRRDLRTQDGALLLVHVLGGENDDRAVAQAGVLRDGVHHFESAHFGHDEVDHEEVHRMSCRERQAFSAARRREDHKVHRHEQFPHQVAMILVVVDHDDGPSRTAVGNDAARRRGRGAGAVYGRKHQLVDDKGNRATVGFRIVRGGAALRVPVLEQVAYLSLNVISIPLRIQRAYTKEGVAVTVEAVANVKIAGDDVSLRGAAERFLGMSTDQIKGVIFQTLEGHLRAILGTLTVEEINADRQAFAQKMTDEAAVDLKKMGVNIDILTIQQISDEQGYLDALGKKRTAEVKRDAVIGEALATRDAMIKSALADQEGKTKRYEADVAIAQSLRDKESRQAEFDAAVQGKQAEAEQAGPLATAIARQRVTEQRHPDVRVFELFAWRPRQRVGGQPAVHLRNGEARVKALDLIRRVARQSRAMGRELPERDLPATTGRDADGRGQKLADRVIERHLACERHLGQEGSGEHFGDRADLEDGVAIERRLSRARIPVREKTPLSVGLQQPHDDTRDPSIVDALLDHLEDVGIRKNRSRRITGACGRATAGCRDGQQDDCGRDRTE